MTNITYVLWALPKGETRTWAEEVVTEVETLAELEAAKKQATDNGFHHLRVSKMDMCVKPDFFGAIRR